MSYIDARLDKERDIIHVVERVDGRREYREYPANYVFYYEDPRGKHKTIHGAPCSKFSTRNNKEFQKELINQWVTVSKKIQDLLQKVIGEFESSM